MRKIINDNRCGSAVANRTLAPTVYQASYHCPLSLLRCHELHHNINKVPRPTHHSRLPGTPHHTWIAMYQTLDSTLLRQSLPLQDGTDHHICRLLILDPAPHNRTYSANSFQILQHDAGEFGAIHVDFHPSHSQQHLITHMYCI